MKICVYGVGAIGGFVAARLAQGGAEVTLIARGAQLEAIRARGLKVISDGQAAVVKVPCSDDPAEVGQQDAVLIATKAQSTPAIAENLQHLLGPETVIAAVQNGIPWWYFHGVGGRFEGHRLASVDPDGNLWRLLPPERCLGCVVYIASEVLEPGVIQHNFSTKLVVGELDGSTTPRLRHLAEALRLGDLDIPIHPKIREEIWMKLWGNLSFNPISVLTGGNLREIAVDPDTRAVARVMMLEAQAVARSLGITSLIDVDARLDRAAGVGPHKSSMLQDLERGRDLETDALVAVVAEIGRLTGVETPMIDAILGLVRQRSKLAHQSRAKFAKIS